ncbi:hypothetical protein ACX3YD_27575 [Pseudomonas fluorescens group sp. PF-1]|jgi:hypothetical protein|uniref:hypothetical protein n=1 Tax=Pseudomonas sp. DP16D-R1 TaxID=2075551 RepID=UPI000CD13FD0|nr:hypothetical protein [Pseudomonas sp. DP16D-R1]POA77110.1 hypothetical protein C1890_17235 [Pseudomonas sp. DP16D-R1]
MGAQAWVAVFILAVAGVIVLATLSATSLLSSTTSTVIGIAEQVATDIQLLAALALNPAQTIIMIALQATGLATITPFMQALNLVMIAATL